MKSKWDNNTIDFARKSENICDSYLMYLTGHTSQQWFKSMVKEKENNRTDYSSIDIKNRSLTVELKTRNINIDKYQDIMIEPAKFNALTGATTDKSIYINFLGSEKEFIIFDIKEIMFLPIRKETDINISNKELGKDYDYTTNRLFFNKIYGHYYKLDESNNKYKKIW
ncbi:hypothetical protein [uncultured Bacteroides sp.]|uniref:hypothetical protein n=1 Tax=uncultured Bacteroides sp. TaxID=162156 RepID=UPI002AA7A8D1|nr:hypothetical protein [uncultured Bacteroides sp.]